MSYSCLLYTSYLSEFLGGTVTFTGNYPAWEYKKDSKVRELVLDVYRDLYQKEPKIEAIHAGLECGILSEKIENLDCVSSVSYTHLDVYKRQLSRCL